MSADPQEVNKLWRFEPLADYQTPSMPTQETFRKKFDQLLKRVRPARSGQVEVSDALKAAPADVLDRAAPKPAFKPFYDALDAIVDEWLVDREPKNRVMVIIAPACLEFDLMRTWAEHRHADVAADPSGKVVIDGDMSAVPSLEGETLLVVPALERWYFRHRAGLVLIRELIARLSNTKRRCVIGVNSWAWTYLTKAADAAVELPPPLTLAPFDDRALCAWLSDLAESPHPRSVIFRSDRSGEVVFDPADHCSTSGKAKGEIGRNDFLKRLAAVSRGSPWLAWHIFRACMRVVPADAQTAVEATPERDDPRETVWIDPVAEVSLPDLPKAVRASALLVFHALLLHGELDGVELRDVLPPINASHVLHRLAAERLLLNHSGRWRVAPAAYPAVRDALAHAGFPVDQL